MPNTVNNQEQRTVETVEEEISETRADLDHTLDEIGRRLSPQEMKERVVDYAKQGASQVGELIQREQWPLAVVGTVAGVALIVHHRVQARAARERAEQIRTVWERLSASLPSPDSAQAASAFSNVASQVNDLADDIRQRVAQVADEAVQYAQQAIRSESATRVLEPAKRAIASLEEHPQAQLFTLGIGLIAGTLLSRMLRS